MDVHFINVGQGNMVLIVIPGNHIIVNDCNITSENEENVLSYVGKIIGESSIDIFINSHRDADHMRGIKKLNEKFGIGEIWDSGVPGVTKH
jgi:beta-lactamase superfamily II metal-dependent hydrolase